MCCTSLHLSLCHLFLCLSVSFLSLSLLLFLLRSISSDVNVINDHNPCLHADLSQCCSVLSVRHRHAAPARWDARIIGVLSIALAIGSSMTGDDCLICLVVAYFFTLLSAMSFSFPRSIFATISRRASISYRNDACTSRSFPFFHFLRHRAYVHLCLRLIRSFDRTENPSPSETSGYKKYTCTFATRGFRSRVRRCSVS